MSRHPFAAITVAYLTFLLLTACASLGLAPAATFEEKLAYAVSQNAAVRQTAANSLEAGDIALADAQSVLKLTDEARTLLDAARLAAGAGDLSTAEARLGLATTILVKLQAYLRERNQA
jgi:hypothetical protein